MVLLLPCLWYLPHHQPEDGPTGSRPLLSQDPPPEHCSFLAWSQGDPACPRRCGTQGDSVPALGSLSLIVSPAAPAQKQFRRPKGKPTLPNHALSQCGWGGGGHPNGNKGQGGKVGKGPAPSWLGFQQVASQQDVGSSKGGAEEQWIHNGQGEGNHGTGRGEQQQEATPLRSLRGQEVATVCGPSAWQWGWRGRGKAAIAVARQRGAGIWKAWTSLSSLVALLPQPPVGRT